MLSLGRSPGQYVVIGENIVIQVVSINGDLRLAIDAPRELSIERGENYEKNHEIPSCIRRSLELDRGRKKPAVQERQKAALKRF